MCVGTCSGHTARRHHARAIVLLMTYVKPHPQMDLNCYANRNWKRRSFSRGFEETRVRRDLKKLCAWYDLNYFKINLKLVFFSCPLPLKKGNEPHLVLLACRSTPLSNEYSPAELLLNRKLRMNMPSSREARKLQVPDRKLLGEREDKLRWKQKVTFDRLHRAQDLSHTLPGDLVWVSDRREQGTVGDEIAPRCEVETPFGTFRRNRRDRFHLLLKIFRLQDQRVVTLTQKWPLMTNHSQEMGYHHHQLIPFEGAVTCINLMVITLVPGSTWKRGDGVGSLWDI